MTTTAIIVPARLGSTRFPQKLLHPVQGKPIILWTAERIRTEAPEFPLHFAVDSETLATPLRDAGFSVHLTNPDLPSGTDRIAAANQTIRADRILNVQGDEPMVRGEQIRLLDQLLGENIDMATLGRPLQQEDDYTNPNHVKVVRARDGRALYFSRAPIPYVQGNHGRYSEALQDQDHVLVHLGLYAYTAAMLSRFAQLKPTPLEQMERLEMLRAMEHGYTLAVGVTAHCLVEIDTPENIAEFEHAISHKS